MDSSPRIVAVGFYGSLVAPAAVGIEMATLSPWAHCYAITDCNTIIDATKAHGVKERELFNPLGPPWSTWWDTVPLTGMIEAKQRRIYADLKSQCGKPYDLDWIWAYPFNRNWQDDDAWVCAELIGWAIQQTGWIELPNKLRRLTPGQLRQALR